MGGSKYDSFAPSHYLDYPSSAMLHNAHVSLQQEEKPMVERARIVVVGTLQVLVVHRIPHHLWELTLTTPLAIMQVQLLTMVLQLLNQGILVVVLVEVLVLVVALVVAIMGEGDDRRGRCGYSPIIYLLSMSSWI